MSLRKLTVTMATIFMLSLGSSQTTLSANTNDSNIDSDKTTIVYADLKNEMEVKATAKNAFDLGYNIVEVRNKESMIKPYGSGWETNTRRYFYGDLFHASEGTITCFVVVGTTVDHVTNCDSKVTIVGSNVKFAGKSISNNNTMNARLNWWINLTGTIPTTKAHSVPLFD